MPASNANQDNEEEQDTEGREEEIDKIGRVDEQEQDEEQERKKQLNINHGDEEDNDIEEDEEEKNNDRSEIISALFSSYSQNNKGEIGYSKNENINNTDFNISDKEILASPKSSVIGIATSSSSQYSTSTQYSSYSTKSKLRVDETSSVVHITKDEDDDFVMINKDTSCIDNSADRVEIGKKTIERVENNVSMTLNLNEGGVLASPSTTPRGRLLCRSPRTPRKSDVLVVGSSRLPPTLGPAMHRPNSSRGENNVDTSRSEKLEETSRSVNVDTSRTVDEYEDFHSLISNVVGIDPGLEALLYPGTKYLQDSDTISLPLVPGSDTSALISDGANTSRSTQTGRRDSSSSIFGYSKMKNTSRESLDVDSDSTVDSQIGFVRQKTVKFVQAEKPLESLIIEESKKYEPTKSPADNVANGFPSIYHFGSYIKKEYKDGKRLPRSGFWTCCGASEELSIKCPSEAARKSQQLRRKMWLETDIKDAKKLAKARKLKKDWLEQKAFDEEMEKQKKMKDIIHAPSVDAELVPENLVMLLVVMRKNIKSEFLTKQSFEMLQRILYTSDESIAREAAEKCEEYEGITIMLDTRGPYLKEIKINQYIMKCLSAMFRFPTVKEKMKYEPRVVEEICRIMLQYPNNEGFIHSILEMLAFFCDQNEVNQATLKRGNVLHFVFKYLQDHIVDADITLMCVKILIFGTIDVKSCLEIIIAGGVRLSLVIIQFYLEFNNEGILSNVMSLLFNMVRLEEGIEDMKEENGVIQIFYVLQRLINMLELQQKGMILLRTMVQIPYFREQLDKKSGSWQWLCQGTDEGDRLVHKHRGPFHSKGWCTSEIYGATMMPPPNLRVVRFAEYPKKEITVQPETGIKMGWSLSKLNEYASEIGYDVDYEMYKILRNCELLPYYAESPNMWLERVKLFEETNFVNLSRYANFCKNPIYEDDSMATVTSKAMRKKTERPIAEKPVNLTAAEKMKNDIERVFKCGKKKVEAVEEIDYKDEVARRKAKRIAGLNKPKKKDQYASMKSIFDALKMSKRHQLEKQIKKAEQQYKKTQELQAQALRIAADNDLKEKLRAEKEEAAKRKQQQKARTVVRKKQGDSGSDSDENSESDD